MYNQWRFSRDIDMRVHATATDSPTEKLSTNGFRASGKEYQFEIIVYWDDKPNGDVRVIGNVDDGGWRAYFPLGTSFLKAPDGTFIGE